MICWNRVMRMRLRPLMAAWRLFVTLGSYTSRCLEMTVTGNPGLAKTYRAWLTHSYSTYHSFTCPHTRPITHRLITRHIHTISHSLTHSLIHQPHSHSLTHPHILTLTLLHIRSHTIHSLIQTYTVSHIHSFTHSPSTFSPYHTFTPSPTDTLSLTHLIQQKHTRSITLSASFSVGGSNEG